MSETDAKWDKFRKILFIGTEEKFLHLYENKLKKISFKTI